MRYASAWRNGVVVSCRRKLMRRPYAQDNMDTYRRRHCGVGGQPGWLDLIRPGKPGFSLPVAQHLPIHCANKQMTRTPGAAKPL